MVRKARGSGTMRTSAGKLHSPFLGGAAVERPRLIAALDAGFESPGPSFMMLSAPAGYGKTYLLSQWTERTQARGIVTAWCGLTVDDRDPLVLWNSMLAALVKSSPDGNPQLSAALLDLLPDMEAQAHATFQGLLYATLSEYPGSIALIFDNAELLEGSASELEFIRILLGVPENVRIAFATRSPLQTQRARVSGRLVELTADSLSFSRAETAELFALRGFEGSDIEQIHSTAEGWPAALSLAVMRVQAATGAGQPISDWHDPVILYDYLRREVWEDLSEPERDVLLTMGIVPLTNGELVSAIGSIDESAAVLRELALNNRMVNRISTDVDGRTWYRVQPLFGSFLRARLADTRPSGVSGMIERAVDWYILNGNALTALALALDGAEAKLVDRILRLRGYQIISEGHAEQLIEQMPPASHQAMTGPFARLMMAYACACAGLLDRAEEFLRAPHIDDLSVDDLLEWDWLHYLVQLQLSIASGRPIELVSAGWGEHELGAVPEPLRLAIYLARGLAESRSGRSQLAADHLRLAAAGAENDDDLSNMFLAQVGLAGLAAIESRFRNAQSLSNRAFELESRTTTQNHAGTQALAHGIAAWASIELLEQETARDHADLAVKFAAQQRDESLALEVRHLWYDAFFDILTQKRRIAQEFVTAWPGSYLRGAAPTSVLGSLYLGLRMAAHLDEHRWSEKMLDRARQLIGEGPDWQVAYSLHLLKTGREDSARTVLWPLVGASASVPARLSRVVAASIESVLEARANNPFRAHAAIYRALELADELGAYREVTRAGSSAVAQVLAAGSGRFGPHEHIVKLLLSSKEGESVLRSGPLTLRERQILAELTTLRTVDEIAQDLLLSVNTVKTHMRGIYRKLEVGSRRQAVAKAERLGLL